MVGSIWLCSKAYLFFPGAVFVLNLILVIYVILIMATTLNVCV